MNTVQLPDGSTRLGNMAFSPAGVSLEVDGQPVWIRKENDGPSVAALQGFYRAALGDYQARQRHARPGWITRLRNWLGRVLGRPEPAAGEPRMEFRGVAGTAAPADAPEPKPGRPAPSPRPGPQVTMPQPQVHAPAATEEPFLRAVFADPGGVHMVWRRTNSGRQPEETETVCALDSRVADSLQDCYGHLARLGYKVIGLDLRPIGGPGAGRDGAIPSRSGAAPVVPGRQVETKEQTIIMRLNPEIPEQPNRALVSPVDSMENTQILVAPERLLKSLRAAADPSRPREDRLTCLRCAMGRGGLKVVDVGLGEGKGNSPARWAEVSEWSAEQAEKAPNPKRPQPVPVTTQAADPELNLSP